MRRRYIVTYDVSNPKRLKRTFKVMRDFGSHLQLSVFECLLTDVERIRLMDRLREEINDREDQILFFDLGLAESEQDVPVTSMGRSYRPQAVRSVIV